MSWVRKGLVNFRAALSNSDLVVGDPQCQFPLLYSLCMDISVHAPEAGLEDWRGVSALSVWTLPLACRRPHPAH